jgi:hypothetical protein
VLELTLILPEQNSPKIKQSQQKEGPSKPDLPFVYWLGELLESLHKIYFRSNTNLVQSRHSDTTFFMGALYTWNTMQCHLIYNDIQQGISMAGLIMRV